MDRFIAPQNYIPYIPKYNLKSNMDRFIAILKTIVNNLFQYLKSNMDRFIDLPFRQN